MRATWNPLPAWPYPPRPRRSDRFNSSWEATLRKLEDEIAAVKGSDVVIGLVCDPSQISISGVPKGGGRIAVRHAGAEVSFDVPGDRRLVFHTDAYPSLASNLRAIALGLEALRAVDRYGITSTAEQYAGFAQLTAGGPDPIRGQVLVEQAGSVVEALRKHHPDHGGREADFVDVQAYRELVGGGR
jgi:hypothetical protein